MYRIQPSATYLVLKAMIQNGSLVMPPAELATSLKFFEKTCLITTVEYRALLEIAMKFKANDESKKVL